MGKTDASAAKQAAKEYNQNERSATERAADKAKRAPVTTDYQRWESDPAGLDFPGVDTPTGSPDVLPKDLKQRQKPDLSARARNEQPNTPVEQTTQDLERRGAKMRGVSPGEDRSSMVADGLGGVRYNVKIGGYRETDRPGEEMRPPGDAIERQDEFLSIESRERDAAAAGVLDPPDDPYDMSDGRGPLSDGNRRKTELDLPDETLSFARTQLNEKVYGEGRGDLDDLRERVSPGETIEVDRSEYQALKNAVFQGANEANDRAKEMDRNIFGDTDEQAAFANTARQGIINNPPSFGGDRR